MALKLPVRSLQSSSMLTRRVCAVSATSTRSVLVQSRPTLATQQRTITSPSKTIKPSSNLHTARLSRTPSRPSSLVPRTSFSIRHNTSAASSAAAPPSPSTTTPANVTWDEYLALRTKRRRINVIFSAACAITTTAMGASFIASQDIEQLNSFSFNLDPMLVLGAATAACGTIGWLIGPFLGGAVFSVIYRRVGPIMREKEKDFFNRIKRHRSDPSGQSMNNPVPDYYGEKITSVKDYRRWLKDQRAFRKKKEVDVI